jgi:hypothetical protein
VGIIGSLKNSRDQKRYGGLGEMKPGVQAFPYRDWKSHHVRRYCELAEASGFEVHLASGEEARSYERRLAEAGAEIGRSWHVVLWRPGEARPELPAQLAGAGQPRPDETVS